MNRRRSSFALILGLLLLMPATANAATASASKAASGISLSPFLQQINIQPTDAAKSFTLTLTNHTSSLQEIDLKTQDFGSLNDTGGLLLIGQSTNYAQKYGLTSWLVLEADTVILQPGESRGVLITIDNRPDLQPGGHYGAIVASVNSLNNQSGNHVVINQQLLSLVLVDKTGGEHFDLKLDGISQNGNWLHLPNTAELRFQNPGNVHVIPRGLVKLKSPAGTVIAQGIINSESAYILPDTFRELYVPLTPVGKALPVPGLYHLEVDYRYDQITRYAVRTAPVPFIDLGLYVLLAVILVTGVVIWRRRGRQTKRRATSTKE